MHAKRGPWLLWSFLSGAVSYSAFTGNFSSQDTSEFVHFLAPLKQPLSMHLDLNIIHMHWQRTKVGRIGKKIRMTHRKERGTRVTCVQSCVLALLFSKESRRKSTRRGKRQKKKRTKNPPCNKAESALLLTQDESTQWRQCHLVASCKLQGALWW